MKKKINIQFLLIALLAIAATWILAAVVFYELFQREVMRDLQSYARLLAATKALEQMEEGDSYIEADDLRITLIGQEGEVLFDSNVDSGEMDNHRNRPEVASAFESGFGTSVRKSPTMGRNTYYYALRTERGSVLRLAKEAGSIGAIFGSAIPMILVIALLLFALCMVLAHYLTRSLVAPIEQMAGQIDTVSERGIYKELLPVVTTIRKQHEDIMKNARMRQEFTANVSHELKTPLTSISGYSELIESGMANEKDTVRFAGEIHKSAKRLLTLINDIIRLSELDEEKEELSVEEVDLFELAQSCVDMLQINAEKHLVTVALQGEHVSLAVNRGMLEEVIYNLCDNAIRYNNAGGTVTVRVYREGKQTVLSVKDTGIGIPKEHQERIFERFYRVDKSRSKSTGGTGLGLAIVKHIIARHGAQMTLLSEAGKGTEIRVLFDSQNENTNHHETDDGIMLPR